MSPIMAYPNPFNPETETLTIKPSDSTIFSGNVEYTIYNYNQRPVYSGSVSNSAIYWSGHKGNGNRVPPGLYIVKIIQTQNDYSTGVGYVKVLVK